MWRQDLAILSPEGPRDSTCQLRMESWCNSRAMESQTRSSKRAFRELKMGGCNETLCQPCANPSPTFRQPFANLFCQPLSKLLFPWAPMTRLETRVNGFLEERVGFGKRGLLEKGSFQKSPFLEILENLEILEILENPHTLENKGKSGENLEIPENLEILEILRDSSSEKTPFVMTPFSCPERERVKLQSFEGHTLVSL